jgi:DNA anti-recombination protein RmuC
MPKCSVWGVRQKPTCFFARLLQVSELKARCSELPALRNEQRQLSADASEAERLAALNSELRLRNLDLSSLQHEAARLGPLAEEAQMLKQQLEEMEEDAAELPIVKVGYGWVY